MNPFGKHLPEFRAALAENRYERTEFGLLFPRQHALLRGEAFVDGESVGHNLLTDEGINLIATDTFPSVMYAALFSGNVTPLASWTGANFASNATEITSTSEGYVESTRPTVPTIDGSGSAVIEFNMRTATTISVYGLGIMDNNTRGGTSGHCIAALRMSSAPRSYVNLAMAEIRYTMSVAAT